MKRANQNTVKPKMVFIDIDGTLVDDEGNIPLSARQACQQARENGHLLYLCTGRSKAEVYDAIWEVGFDGLIGAGGGYVEFGDIDNDPLARAKKEQQPHPFISGITYGETNLYKQDVNKVCFLERPSVPFERIKQEFDGKFGVIQCTVPIFGEGSGELTILGVHKAAAIADLINHVGISQEDTIAIGDGMNDVEMLAFCHVGVAVGNAKPGLKAIADDVTGTVQEDGLYHAFVKYGLIKG